MQKRSSHCACVHASHHSTSLRGALGGRTAVGSRAEADAVGVGQMSAVDGDNRMDGAGRQSDAVAHCTRTRTLAAVKCAGFRYLLRVTVTFRVRECCPRAGPPLQPGNRTPESSVLAPRPVQDCAPGFTCYDPCSCFTAPFKLYHTHTPHCTGARCNLLLLGSAALPQLGRRQVHAEMALRQPHEGIADSGRYRVFRVA